MELLGCIIQLAAFSQESKLSAQMRRSTYRSAVPDGTDLHRPPPPDGTRERILAAAFEIFAERGFDGARTRDIADRAGANLGLIKYYFDGKERLWKAAVTRAFAELQAEFAAALPSRDDADPLTWLEYVIRQFVRFVARRPAFMRLMNDEAKRDSARMRWLADRFVRPMNDAIVAHLLRAQADGLVPPISPVSLRYIVIGAAGLVFSQAPECRYLTGVDPTEPEFAEQHAEALITLFMGRRPKWRSSRARRRRP
ncbi:MAG: TetR/AcrR family transcriptional regulator [Deltaproteobacteria bacterium]|nr:MAG: TetR/AcrR family transcriptional regulator [Deltaproteobacteria bacterium]